MVKNLADFVLQYATLENDKPADAQIEEQRAIVKEDGTVSVRFDSNDPAVVRQLRDWLTSILGA